MTVRIAGVVLPNDKRIEVALTYIYGLGISKSRQILAKAKVNPDTRTKDLTEDEANRLRILIEKNEVVKFKLYGFCFVSFFCSPLGGICQAIPEILKLQSAMSVVQVWFCSISSISIESFTHHIVLQ